MHSSCMLREGARPEVGRDNMGHANIDVTQNVYGKSWWGAGGCGHPSCRSRNQSSSFMIRMVLSYRLAMREREIRHTTESIPQIEAWCQHQVQGCCTQDLPPYNAFANFMRSAVVEYTPPARIDCEQNGLRTQLLQVRNRGLLGMTLRESHSVKAETLRDFNLYAAQRSD